MTKSSATAWEQLFPQRDKNIRPAALRLRLVSKRGEPLLLLPELPRLAQLALALYPAQSGKARLARRVLHAGLRFAPGWVTKPLVLETDSAAPFMQFLARTAGTTALHSLAMLLGNPRAAGRRFVILLFNDHGAPAALVKVGTDPQATALIEAEWSFLKAQPSDLLQAPTLREGFQDGEVRAFGMEFVNGTTPPSDAPVGALLQKWLLPQQTVRFADLPVARRLEAVASGDPLWTETANALRAAQFHPAIHHGDFAPWNIRVDPAGKWRVLDWERGEPVGPPAWDWFHWVIQYEVLVRRAATDELNWRLDALCNSAEFQAYAARAGIAGIIRPLLIAYLMHCSRVIRQVDGLSAIESLLASLAHPASCRCHAH